MMTSPYEFTGTPLIGVGQVRGYRSFAWTPDGRLTAPVYGDEWQPGTNVAQCHRSRGQAGSMYRAIQTVQQSYNKVGEAMLQAADAVAAATRILNGPDGDWIPYGARPAGSAREPYGPRPGWWGPDSRPVDYAAIQKALPASSRYGCATHNVDDCRCGFYAYTDGSRNLPGHDEAVAAVEGYGQVVIGSRGFRAQQARVVALCIRPHEPFTFWGGDLEEVRQVFATRWRVPVYTDLDRMIAEYPHDLLEDLQ